MDFGPTSAPTVWEIVGSIDDDDTAIPESYDRHFIAAALAQFGDPEDDHARPILTSHDTILAIQRGRNKRGWTQGDLAKKMNVNVTVVKELESGKGLFDTSVVNFVWHVFDENPPPAVPPKREETPPPPPQQPIVKKPLHQGKSKTVIPDDPFAVAKKKNKPKTQAKKKK
jgi:DNA-binding transcriptional regulator YiaG